MLPTQQTKPCAPLQRCRLYKSCTQCANIRQLKIAAHAELIERHIPALVLSVIVPNDPGAAALRTARDNWLRSARPDAGVWTVETGEKTGILHANILHTPTKKLRATKYRVHSELLRKPARAAALYISKPGQIPTPEEYSGHLWRKVGPLWPYLLHTANPETMLTAAANVAAYKLGLLTAAQVSAIKSQDHAHLQLAKARAIINKWERN